MIQNLASKIFGSKKVVDSFAAIGVAVTAYKALRVLHTLYRQVRSGYNLSDRYNEGNSYAFVTGATDGIGRGFCEELARLGFNIVILARNLQKAQDLAGELATKYGIKTRIILADFSNCHQDGFFEEILQQVSDLDIALLVNSIGLYIPWGLNLAQFSNQYLRDFVNTNVLPQTILSTRLIDKMLKRTKRSGIINLSSFAAEHPQGIQGAVKSYNDAFSRAQSLEFGHKIDVMSLRPRLVRTPMTNFTTVAGSITTQECVTAALKRLGKEAYTNGHYKHGIQSYAHGLFPSDLAHAYRWSVASANARNIKMKADPEYDRTKSGVGSDLTVNSVRLTVDAAVFDEFLRFCLEILQFQRIGDGTEGTSIGYLGRNFTLNIIRAANSRAEAVKQDDEYDNANPLRYIEIQFPQDKIAKLKKEAGKRVITEFIENGKSSLLLVAVGGYRFRVVESVDTPRITGVSLYANHYYAQRFFWLQKLHVRSANSATDSVTLQTANNVSIEFVRRGDGKIDVSRVALELAVPQLEIVERTVFGSGTGKIVAEVGKQTVLSVVDAEGYHYTFTKI